MKKILFVCTGNSCRSVMAEGLFRKLIGAKASDYSAASAGISAVDGFPPSEPTVRALKDQGIDVTDHQSQRLSSELVNDAHKVIVMEKMHRDWVLELVPDAAEKTELLTQYSSKQTSRLSDIDIPDPIRMSESFYKNVLTVIRECVQNFIKTL